MTHRRAAFLKGNVMQSIKPVKQQSLALRFNQQLQVMAVGSLAEAVELWRGIRDENNLGASAMPSVTVVDTDTGATVARISYNGRLWDSQGNQIAP
jgi:hypothetical protein